jgi:citrate synthase
MINLDDELLTAREAAGRLGIKLDTLYAYVSRGRLASVTVPGSRERRYPATAVAALQRPGGTPPGLNEAIAGLPAVAETASLEEAARLLWRSRSPLPEATAPAFGEAPPGAGFLVRAQIRLAAVSAAAAELTPAGSVRSGRAIVRALCVCAAGSKAASGPAHLGLAAGWGLDAGGAELLRRCRPRRPSSPGPSPAPAARPMPRSARRWRRCRAGSARPARRRSSPKWRARRRRRSR